RRLLWMFKDGVSFVSEHFAREISSHLLNYFEAGSLQFRQTDIVAVIPASSKEKNERRYLNFCRKVSELTSLVNGFSAIQVSHDRIAYKGKVGVDKISNLVFDI